VRANRKKAVSHAMQEVAGLLGNTAAVARSSNVDPRVVDLYEMGTVADVEPDTPREEAEREVLEILSDA
jgi:DNA topoisomerase I